MPRQAIFIDRDGVLCHSGGLIATVDPIRLESTAATAIRRLNTHGRQVVVVTQQPGIAFGELDEDTLAELHEKMRLLLLEQDARLDGIYHCPHHPEGTIERYGRDCRCRIPGTALFERARDEMGVALEASFFLSRSRDSLRAAKACGITTVLLGGDSGGDPAIDRCVDSIDAAADWTLGSRAPSAVTTS
jgi:D-glycero-D-manno-heptose 1,7-bisphosphate phosphatase